MNQPHGIHSLRHAQSISELSQQCRTYTEAIQNYPTTSYVMHFSHSRKFCHYECIDLLRNFGLDVIT